ncbi:MAG: flagellin [Candidatus Poribacteria bacterium]|nr:MAG: flagellin [Candidatus Poribacteria bacterium]
MFRINTNVAALVAQRNISQLGSEINTRLERLSSGLRINRAADDPAGLTASETFVAQIAGQRAAMENVNRAVALIQTAESGLDQLGDIYVRLKELAIQAADGTISNDARTQISEEATQLVNEVIRIVKATQFNSLTLLETSGTNNFTLYVGDGSAGTSNETLLLSYGGVIVNTSGIGTINGTAIKLTLSFYGSATAAAELAAVAESAVTEIAEVRAQLGAFQRRLESAQNNLATAMTSAQSSLSAIRDADFATETAALTRAQVLAQAGIAALSQANLIPANVLALLG